MELETCRERGQTEVMVRSSLVDLTWIIRLETVHNLLLTEDLLSRHLLLGLGAGLVLHLPSVGLSSRFDLVCKLHFLTLHHVSGDIPQLGILSDLGKTFRIRRTLIIESKSIKRKILGNLVTRLECSRRNEENTLQYIPCSEVWRTWEIHSHKHLAPASC